MVPFPHLWVDLTPQDTPRRQTACGQHWPTVVGNVLQWRQSLLLGLPQASKKLLSSFAVPLPHLWVLNAADIEYLFIKSLG